jgi:hypothetical protein
MSILCRTVYLTVTILISLNFLSCTDSVYATSLEEGEYVGTTKDKSEMNISLVRSGDIVKIKRLGYHFTGSLRVADVFSKTGEPFGVLSDGEIQFEFPVLVSFAVPNLNVAQVNMNVAAYRGMIKVDKGKMICIVERISTLSSEYQMKNITMEGKMPDGKGMLKKYLFILVNK